MTSVGADRMTSPAVAPQANARIPTSGQRPFVWIDGAFYAKGDAKISVFDHGLLYGDGCFEGIRVYQGKIFKCDTHLNRIYRNAEALHMMRQTDGFPYTQSEMRSILEQCVEANGLTDGYIRLVFTRGVGDLGLHPFRCRKPTVIVIADTIRLYPEEMYRQGMKVIVAKRPRTPAKCLSPQLKSLNYLNNILAKIEAIDADVLESIMLTYSDDPNKKIVGECTGDNLFMVKNGALCTSPLDVPMLDGVTRAFVMQTLAPKIGVAVHERPLTLDEVLHADEIFLTGTAAEIIAVTQIEDTQISEGEGPITAKLRAAFREIVTGPSVPTD
ncbi:MAG: aminotransferase class IV [Phycisphaerales bacterium]|nr:aminotransferase class IV [Phycisphaerales bacterium]